MASEIGAELRRLRNVRRWSQEELAERAGVDQTQISQWERGKVRPSLEMLQKLAGAFGIEAGAFARQLGYLPSATEAVAPKYIVVQTRHGRREVDFAAALAFLEAIPDEHLRRDLAEWRATMSPEAFERHIAELYATMLNSGDAFVSGIRVANGVM